MEQPTTPGGGNVDTYMMDPAEMTDDQLDRWIASFREQPPTMDSLADWHWANRCAAEFQRRMEARLVP
jgi:hypothetical protein